MLILTKEAEQKKPGKGDRRQVRRRYGGKAVSMCGNCQI
jgi:hypothetical protein